MPIKERALIIFSDIDDTLTPLDIDTLTSFLKLVKKIMSDENVVVKFCPISGRQSEYVRAIMNLLSDISENEGIHNFVDFGAGEQGATLIRKTTIGSYEFLGLPQNMNLKNTISKTVMESRSARFLEELPQTDYINVFQIKDKLKNIIQKERICEILSQLRQDIKDIFGDSVHTASTKCFLEVVPGSCGKDKAIKRIFEEYQKIYNIVGITYSGDSENDLRAVRYVSKLAEIPGIKASVILPSNSIDILRSESVEAWKVKIANVGNPDRITTSELPRFRGVTQILRNKFYDRNLLGEGVSIKKTTDDFSLHKSM